MGLGFLKHSHMMVPKGARGVLLIDIQLSIGFMLQKQSRPLIKSLN